MNRKKWQGITCVLLASLMMNPIFATSTRNAEPKIVVSPKPIKTQQPTSQKQNTSSSYPTEGQSITPIQSVTPNKEQAPKKVVAPTQTPSTKMAAPAQTQSPKPAPTSKATEMPAKETKKMDVDKPLEGAPKKEAVPAKQGPKCITPKKEAALKAQTPEKKPFTLDHFKMIVCTLKQLGMEENEIADYVKQGKKLEEILKAKKINPKKFKKCIIKQYNKAIDEGVKGGQITKEQCKQLKAAIKETVNNWLPQCK